MIKTVMVIEDEQDVRKFINNLLLDHGYSVVEASDGVKALDLFLKAMIGANKISRIL